MPSFLRDLWGTFKGSVRDLWGIFEGSLRDLCPENEMECRADPILMASFGKWFRLDLHWRKWKKKTKKQKKGDKRNDQSNHFSANPNQLSRISQWNWNRSPKILKPFKESAEKSCKNPENPTRILKRSKPGHRSSKSNWKTQLEFELFKTRQISEESCRISNLLKTFSDVRRRILLLGEKNVETFHMRRHPIPSLHNCNRSQI